MGDSDLYNHDLIECQTRPRLKLKWSDAQQELSGDNSKTWNRGHMLRVRFILCTLKNRDVGFMYGTCMITISTTWHVTALWPLSTRETYLFCSRAKFLSFAQAAWQTTYIHSHVFYKLGHMTEYRSRSRRRGRKILWSLNKIIILPYTYHYHTLEVRFFPFFFIMTLKRIVSKIRKIYKTLVSSIPSLLGAANTVHITASS